MWQRIVNCLGTPVSIASEVPSIDNQLTAVLRTYFDTREEPALHYLLRVSDWPTLLRDGEATARYDTPLDLVAGFELDLYRQVISRAAGLPLHAAAVVGADRRALIFTGVSGAGKSTLLRALLARDYAYLSEECIVLQRGRACIGLARALNIEDDALQAQAGFVVDDYIVRIGTTLKRTRLFHPPEARICREPARPVALVVLSHAPDAPDTLVRMSTGETLLAVWPSVFRGTPEEVARELGDLPCYHMHTTSPANALRLACGLAQELGVIAP